MLFSRKELTKKLHDNSITPFGACLFLQGIVK